MTGATLKWRGDSQMLGRFDEYNRRVNQAIHAVANYFAPVMETYAKENAIWTDRSANARQGLHGWVEELASDVVSIWLSHGVEYGLWLEVAHQGRYQIIWPTLQTHLEPIRDMLQGIFA